MPAVQQAIATCAICDDFVTDSAYEDMHESCADEHLFECDSCSRVYVNMDFSDRETARAVADSTGYSRTLMYDVNYGFVCEDCVAFCEECDTIHGSYDDAENCCRISRAVNYYSFTPQFRFHNDDGEVSLVMRDDTLYMGIELEMVRVAEFADEFIAMEDEDSDCPSFFYFKDDASIGHNGAELVTMPATLSAFEKKFPFDTLDYARANWRVRAFEYESCGFHIHVNRSAFSPTHMWRFVRFQLKNPMLCQYVGQRESVMYATWQFDQSENAAIPDYVKGKRSNGRRYLAINFQNRATVELRYFKGNILPEAIRKNLQFVHSMYEYTKHMSYEEVIAGGLSESAYFDWLAGLDDATYADLRTYLDDYRRNY